MSVYYNENDPFAAAWLRELIKKGLIADGIVDERSITDVRPDDLAGFIQCHFFAGIGGWSHALRLAGWPEDREVWTGSCPCQPFSSAGAQAGGNDPRDLWPVWFQLVKECRPHVVFGEQVEAAIGHGWLDRLCDDLEAEDYAVGPCGLPGPCVGAFDIRQRLWFVADSDRTGQRSSRWRIRDERHDTRRNGAVGYMAYGERARFSGTNQSQRARLRDAVERRSADDTIITGDGLQRMVYAGEIGNIGQDFWSDCEWIPCQDGKLRPVEPGTFPLAHGVSHRVGRLRGYGNAIKPQVAQVFIEAYLDASSGY